MIGDTFNPNYYSVGRIVNMALISGLLLLADRFLPGEKSRIAAIIIAAFAGAYYYVVFLGYDYFGVFEDGLDRSLTSISTPVMDAIKVLILVIALALPFIMIATAKLALGRRQSRLVEG